MKRLKLIFTAIAVIAVVSTALSMKSSRNLTVCWQNPVGGICPANLACQLVPVTMRRIVASNAHCYQIVPPGTMNCLGVVCPNLAIVSNEGGN